MLYLLCGPKGSGKSTLGEYAASKGIPAIESSDPIHYLLREINIRSVDEALIAKGRKWFAYTSAEWIDNALRARIPQAKHYVRQKPALIIGLRMMTQLRYFRREYQRSVAVIGLFVDSKLAFEHVRDRAKEETKFETEEEFLRARQAPDYSYGLAEILAHHVDRRINVNGDVEHLKKCFDEIVASHHAS